MISKCFSNVFFFKLTLNENSFTLVSDENGNPLLSFNLMALMGL